MTEPHAHRWFISGPESDGTSKPTTEWLCTRCGETKHAVPEWAIPRQFYIADRFKKQLKEMEGME
jgi:heterodisulfide reductase subunit A-like polyferredoxin